VSRERFFDMRRQQQPAAAAALRYDPVKSEPPELVATGRGALAEQIIRIAREHNIPIHADRGLVEALSRLELGEVIPRELYTIVAEVLSWVYHLDAAAGDPERAKNVTPDD
jgi:flagellar biosynthesis protein